jgi:hypothetical protein
MNHLAAGAIAAHRHYGAKDDASRFHQKGSAEQAVPSAKANAMTKFIPTIFGITVIAALLTGCTAGPSDTTPTTAPSATTAPTEAPVAPEPVAPVAPVTGDVVDEATAAALKDANEGQRAYPLDDGTFIVVNKTEPLPAVVQAEIDVKSAVLLAPSTDATSNSNLLLTEPGKVQSLVAKNTGKRVLVAWRVHAFDGYDETATDWWFVSGGPAMTDHYADRASAQAGIDAWLAGKEDAATYAVVFVG